MPTVNAYRFPLPVPITVPCDDGVVRTGEITDAPFMGNEHQPCTLRTPDGQLHAVHVDDVIRVVGREFRAF